ncbi:hypothetical protein ACHAWX_006841, partial [Stephanocyclus meneghinianus]
SNVKKPPHILKIRHHQLVAFSPSQGENHTAFPHNLQSHSEFIISRTAPNGPSKLKRVPFKMKLIVALLAVPMVAAQGTNKTLAPTPGVNRPTPAPNGGSPEPTYVLTTLSPVQTPIPPTPTPPTPAVPSTAFPTGATPEPTYVFPTPPTPAKPTPKPVG